MIDTNLNGLQRIVFHIMVNSLFMKEIGLFHGKIGVAIMLFKYGNTQNNTMFSEYAYELIKQVYDDVHYNMSIDLESGLCGVAWGLIYLIENKFIHGDLDEVLSEIDEKIMEISPSRIKDQSLRTGLTGIYMYMQLRVETSKVHNRKPLFDESFLKEMGDIGRIKNLSESSFGLSNITSSAIEGDSILYHNMPLGLNKGCAGIVLNRIIS